MSPGHFGCDLDGHGFAVLDVMAEHERVDPSPEIVDVGQEEIFATTLEEGVEAAALAKCRCEVAVSGAVV